MNHQALLMPSSQTNRFVAHFYNEFPAEFPADMKK
jgi:hypothetical protein